MKRTLALLLALLMVLPLCACGKKGDEIKLTLDNYKTYLNVTTRTDESGSEVRPPYGVRVSTNTIRTILYSGGSCTLTISGISENFNYNDVKVVVRATGDYKYIIPDDGFVTGELTLATTTSGITYIVPDINKMGVEEVDLTLEAIGDITGHGRDSKEFTFPGGGYSYSAFANCNFEIVEVSGTLTPA